MSEVSALGRVYVGYSGLNKHSACGDVGENYALGIANSLARASEKMNICQQGPAGALLVGG